MTEEFLTTQQVAERLGFAPGTVENWRGEGKGPPYKKLGRSVRYPVEEFEEWKREQGLK